MGAKELVLLVLGGVLVNNYVLTQFLGVTSVLGFSGKGQKPLALGITVAAVMLLSTAILWPVQSNVLAARGLAHLQVPVSLLVILFAAWLVDLIRAKALHQPPKHISLPVAFNSAVLGLAVNNAAAGYGYVESLAAALGVGLGFLAALLVMTGLREKINERYVPAPFRGLPMALITAGIISMALMAF